MCLQGVVVPPDYYAAQVCFVKARDLDELVAHYGLYLARAAEVDFGYRYPSLLEGKCYDHQRPLKLAEVQEGLECVFPLGGSTDAKNIYKEALSDYGDVKNWEWMFKEGQMRGRWFYDHFFENGAYFGDEMAIETQDELADILDRMETQCQEDASMYAWRGFYA
ncbi:hypothetical protein NHP21005_06610 [Helicobacter sp. NHP21005]|uniref:hypothetical protein n=1 Tax=Helicobacter felistomachi TaxID=3040201 RepID=UPI002572FDCD|nr:hypothetical protein [Helicobacter sp. NHP21005]BEG56973.1 hypothetical protein NHP21005_06610 [Helicobacter sp. NHP21005]